MRQEAPILSPSQVSGYIKTWMDRDRLLSGLMVRGELSNYKMYPSGHHYFTLKDGDGALRCVMFRSDASTLRFRPENGMQVIAAGRVTVFPRDGQYQMYCTRLTPDGAGDLHVAFEQMKDRLYKEGLFAPEHKKPLPQFPARIALVTSPAGAAVRDMLRILGARYPVAEIKILPVRVQGEGAAEEIAAAIAWANRWQVADLIITGRGGGSMEDLWAFNEEVVARAIYHSEIPVISAVGHEPDITISDFVADLRAATPSNAAELAVPDQNELYLWLKGVSGRMERGLKQGLRLKRRELERVQRNRIMEHPENYFKDRRMQLDYQGQRMSHGLHRSLAKEKERLARLAASLDALSPLKVLGRGYAIAMKEEGTVVTSVEDVERQDTVNLRLRDGTLKCRIEESRLSKNLPG